MRRRVDHLRFCGGGAFATKYARGMLLSMLAFRVDVEGKKVVRKFRSAFMVFCTEQLCEWCG